MAEEPKDAFTEYLKSRQTDTPIGMRFSGANPGVKSSTTGGEANRGWLAEIVDVLNRGVYLGTETVKAALDLPDDVDRIQRQFATGQTGAAWKDIGSTYLKNLSAPYRGLLTKDPENRETYEGTIERISDVANRNNPDYVDVPDNVDPIGKASLGLALDIFADPLTWIPGVGVAKVATRGTSAAVKAADDVADAARGVQKVPEATQLPALNGIERLSVDNPSVVNQIVKATERAPAVPTRQADEVVQARKQAAESNALQKVSESAGLPAAPATAVAKVADGVDTLPAATLSKKLEETLASPLAGADTAGDVLSALRKQITNKTVKMPDGKRVKLRGGIASLMKTLTEPPKKKFSGKAMSGPQFEKFVNAQIENPGIANVPLAQLFPKVNLAISGGGTSQRIAPTLGGAVNQFNKAADTPAGQFLKRQIFDQIIEPLYKRVVAAQKAGREVDLLARDITPTSALSSVTEASRASILMQNLKNLDEATKTRALALFGEEFFADISNMSLNQLDEFLDSTDILLRETGAIDDLSLFSQSGAMSAYRELFDLDKALYGAAKADVEQRFIDARTTTPESLNKQLDEISNNPNVRNDAIEILTAVGYPIIRRPGQEDQLVDAMMNVLQTAVPKAAKPKFSDKYRSGTGGYAHITDEGVARTDDVFGYGKGIVPNVANTHFQYSLWGSIGTETNKLFFGKDALDIFRGPGMVGDKVAAEKERFQLAVMRLAEKFFEEKGVPLNFDLRLVEGLSPEIKSLKLTQAYDLVKKNMKVLDDSLGERFMRLLFFNGKTGVATTKFMDAIVSATSGGTADDVLSILTSAERRNIPRVEEGTAAGLEKAGGPIPNWLSSADEVFGRFGTQTGLPKNAKKVAGLKNTWEVPATGIRYQKQVSEKGRVTYQVLWSNRVAAQKLADGIMASTDDLAKAAAVNAKAYAQRGIAEGEAISEASAKIIYDIVSDPTRLAEGIKVAAYSGAVVKDVAKSVGNVTALGAQIGNAKTTLAIGKGVKQNTVNATRKAAAVEKQDAKAKTKAMNEGLEQTEEFVKAVDAESARLLDQLAASGQRIEDPAVLRMVEATQARAATHANNKLQAIVDGAYATIKTNILKALNPLNTFFNPRKGMRAEDQLWISELLHGKENKIGYLYDEYLIPINQLGKEYNGFVDDSTTILQQAYNNIKNGVQGTGLVGEAQTKLAAFMARMFDVSGQPENAVLGNIFLRNMTGIERVNEVLARNDVLRTTAEGIVRSPDEYFDLAKAAEDAAAAAGGKPIQQEDIMRALADQWKTWDVQDPVYFMDKMYRSAIQLVGEVSYMNDFIRQADALGFVSTKPYKNYVALGPESAYSMAKHLPETVYVDPEILDAFVAVDKFVNMNTGLGFGALDPLANAIDEVTYAMKYAMTQPRFGHHIRNFFGSITMTGMAQGARHFIRAHKDSWKLLNRSGYFKSGSIYENEFDVLRALNVYDEPIRATKSNAQSADDILYKSEKTGRSVTYGEMEEAVKRLGILPKARSAEVLAKQLGVSRDFETGSKIGTFTEKFLAGASLGVASRGGRLEQFWTRLSEGQDQLNRLHHFMQYVYQSLDGQAMTRSFGKTIKPKELEDAFSFAAERVNKFHPSIMTLTELERMYPRRLFPFYNWNKGAVHALAETLFMHPGRVNLPNKISYNIGVATGVDPNSMYDPFPNDQPFPSFMVEELQGPQFMLDGRYYGVRPGVAQWDILNQFGASDSAFDAPREAFADSLSPIFKLPLEGLMGTRLSTKSPITDVSDYIDQSIPGVNYISAFTGYSVTGSLADIPRGYGPQQKAKFESGDRGPGDSAISVLNWLTGFGVTDFSRPDYIGLARIEEQQRRAEELERQRREQSR